MSASLRIENHLGIGLIPISSLTPVFLGPALGTDTIYVRSVSPCPSVSPFPEMFPAPVDHHLHPPRSLKRCSRLCLPSLHHKHWLDSIQAFALQQNKSVRHLGTGISSCNSIFTLPPSFFLWSMTCPSWVRVVDVFLYSDRHAHKSS